MSQTSTPLLPAYEELETQMETRDFHPPSMDLPMSAAVTSAPDAKSGMETKDFHPPSMNLPMSAAVTSAPVAKSGMPAQALLGPKNSLCVCPFCNASVETTVKHSTTSRTHIAAAICCLACCLCCVPYCSDSAKNTDHYCPSCKRFLGTYQK